MSWRRFRVASLPSLWTIIVLLMLRDALQDPYVAELVGTSQYGHNGPDEMVDVMGLMIVELVVLLAILRPWSYRESWGRSALALVLAAPLAAFSMLMTMHAGGIITLHFLWLFIVVIALLVATIWGAFFAEANAPDA